MNRKLLLIGGATLADSDIPPEFLRIGSDFLSLHEAQLDYPLDHYGGIVFWVDEHTFDLADRPGRFQAFRKAFSHPSLKKRGLSWQNIHDVIRSPNWSGDDPRWDAWKAVQSACFGYLEPLAVRLFRGGSPIIVVHPLSPEKRLSPVAAYKWFSCHLHGSATRGRPERPVGARCEHPLIQLFNSTLTCFDGWNIAFDVNVATGSGCFSLVGRSLPFDFSRHADYLRDEGELSVCVEREEETGGRLFFIRGLPGGGSGLCRAVLFEAGETGILVVSEPTNARAFLDIIADELGTRDDSGYFLDYSNDCKRMFVKFRGGLLGALGAKTKAAKFICK